MKIFKYTYIVASVLLLFLLGGITALFRTQYMAPRLQSYVRNMPLARKQKVLRGIVEYVSPYTARAVLRWAILPQDLLHDLMPVLGESAHKTWGVHGFSICDGGFRINCYQGVMMGIVQSRGYTPEVIRDAATACEQIVAGNERTQECAQAAGFTTLWLNTYWYIESLQYCDRIFSDTHKQYNCWLGVSHENVNRAGDSLDGLYDAPWATDNIYYPCDSIPLLYQPACVREQMLVIRRRMYANDAKRSAGYCLHFSNSETRYTCVSALIDSIVSENTGESEALRATCNELPNEYRDQCISEAKK